MPFLCVGACSSEVMRCGSKGGETTKSDRRRWRASTGWAKIRKGVSGSCWCSGSAKDGMGYTVLRGRRLPGMAAHVLIKPAM